MAEMAAQGDPGHATRKGEAFEVTPPRVVPAGDDAASTGRAAGTLPSGPPEGSRGPSVWNSAEVRYSFLIAVSALVFAADQASKAIVKSTMNIGEVIPLIPPVLDLHYITN